MLIASAVAIVVANPTSASASTINPASSAIIASAVATALTFRPGGASRGQGQRTPWSSHVGREVEKGLFILVHILLNKEPSLVAGLSQTAFGGNRNPEESGGIRRNPEESGGIRRNSE